MKASEYTLKHSDILALRTFVRRDTVSAIGGVIGVGKESVVYEGRGGLFEREVIIKFHREGMGSFREIRRKRSYLNGREETLGVYAPRLRCRERVQSAQSAISNGLSSLSR
ncbi:hypothetical protein FHEFKHOI_01908 [Candidatus Methanoperedenaceae archaeon GB50]|nr:hypothetical protein FHEFKHOI_01908 [Candidatus Methanoperedenaceae archaeon GB50]